MNTLILISLLLAHSKCPSDITPETIQALIHVESTGNPRAVSRTGAVGLMQVSSVALEDYNKRNDTDYIRDDLFNEEVNITVGIDHLCQWKGYEKTSLLVIYWAGKRAYNEIVSGKREYLRPFARKYIGRITQQEAIINKVAMK